MTEQLKTPTCVTGTFSREEFKRSLKEIYNDSSRVIPIRIFLLSAPDEEIEKRIERCRLEGSPSNINTLERFQWAKGFFQPIDFAPVTQIETIRPPDECADEVLWYVPNLIK